MTESTNPPARQIRALYDERAIRVYQAYSPQIADKAVAAQTFRSPFKRDRMTWIKPSFTWMMYRSGYATKPDQERILGIDISREGFEWALAHASLSWFDRSVHRDFAAWQRDLRASPVRVQWDPERTLRLGELPWRSIQIGLGGAAVDAYVDRWIVRVEDLTPLSRDIAACLARDDVERAEALRPIELPYDLPAEIAARIGRTGRDA